MSEEIKNLIIETQIELENIGKDLLKCVPKSSMEYSELFSFFIKNIYVDLTNVTRQYLQLVNADEEDLKQSTKIEIKNKLLRCSVKAWEQLAKVKKIKTEKSFKFFLLSKIKQDYKIKIEETNNIQKELDSTTINLSLEEKIERLKRIVLLYDSLHTTEWTKNPLLVVSIIGLTIAVIAIIITIILYLAAKNNDVPNSINDSTKIIIPFIFPLFKKKGN